jgi:hypothetical protein
MKDPLAGLQNWLQLRLHAKPCQTRCGEAAPPEEPLKIRSLEPNNGGGARKRGSGSSRPLDLLVHARGSEAWVEAGDASRKARAEATAGGRRRRRQQEPARGATGEGRRE